jgi:hypothetical protein
LRQRCDARPGRRALRHPGLFNAEGGGARFRAENLTIENGFDYPAKPGKIAAMTRAKSKIRKAVAVMTDRRERPGGVPQTDKIAGYQDTLFPDTGRSCF